MLYPAPVATTITTDRANRVVEGVLRTFATSFKSWGSFLPMVEFALNNAVHASTGLTPFYANYGRHPRFPALLGTARTMPQGDADNENDLAHLPNVQVVSGTAAAGDPRRERVDGVISTLMNGRARAIAYEATSGAVTPPAPHPANFDPIPSPQTSDITAVSEFLQRRQGVVRYVRDAIVMAVDRQEEKADRHDRKNIEKFAVGDRVLRSTTDIQPILVTHFGANKLASRYIAPVKVLKVVGDAYALHLPATRRLHPTFYVGRLR
ncbi:unnamed protein product [Phytophthora fragariaefolia]|uniref:Unnamed protein product n=1 Tax=Phytophthora fragariaefolia TaxID=1490495 RepID=A0A9W6TLT3_9STRA|nr:unnamed protein product [Phytophthora fragariaefolia]